MLNGYLLLAHCECPIHPVLLKMPISLCKPSTLHLRSHLGRMKAGGFVFWNPFPVSLIPPRGSSMYPEVVTESCPSDQHWSPCSVCCSLLPSVHGLQGLTLHQAAPQSLPELFTEYREIILTRIAISSYFKAPLWMCCPVCHAVAPSWDCWGRALLVPSPTDLPGQVSCHLPGVSHPSSAWLTGCCCGDGAEVAKPCLKLF